MRNISLQKSAVNAILGLQTIVAEDNVLGEIPMKWVTYTLENLAQAALKQETLKEKRPLPS